LLGKEDPLTIYNTHLSSTHFLSSGKKAGGGSARGCMDDSTAMTSKLKLAGPRYSITAGAEMDDTECQPPKRERKKSRRRRQISKIKLKEEKKKEEKSLDDDDLKTPSLKIDKCHRHRSSVETLVLNTHTHTHGGDNEFWNVTGPHVVTVKCDLHFSISNRVK
jgi:hypothetical protein